MTQLESVSVKLVADTDEFKREMQEASKLASAFGRLMTKAFEDATVRGRGFGDVMRGVAARLSSIVISAAMRPFEQMIAKTLEGIFIPGGSPAPRTTTPPIIPFAKGGVIAAPSYFPLGGSLGLAGEKGAEAILPLSRGADGRLGVRSESSARPLSVTVNIATPDAVSFRRSESYVSAAIARAVARGERSL